VAAKAGGALLPSSPVDRARAAIWADQIVGKFTGAFYALLRCYDESQVAAKTAALIDAAAAAGDFIGGGAGPFVSGASVSLPDFLLWPFVERLCVVEHYRAFQLPSSGTTRGLETFAAWCAAMRKNKSVTETAQDAAFFINGYAGYAKPPTVSS
jgi:glutathione S-transferase